MPVSLPLLFTTSKGLEDFGEAESVLCILCLQPSLHSAAVRKVLIDELAGMGVERMLLTESQLALRLLALLSPFLRLLRIRVVEYYPPIPSRNIESFLPISFLCWSVKDSQRLSTIACVCFV